MLREQASLPQRFLPVVSMGLWGTGRLHQTHGQMSWGLTGMGQVGLGIMRLRMEIRPKS